MQVPRFRAFERQQHAKIIECVVANWDGLPNTVRLSANSRKKFIDVLIEHGQLPLTAGPYIQYVVLFETGRLADRVQDVLTEEEWDKLKIQVTQARRHEPVVRNAGEWPLTEQDDDAETVDAVKD